MITSLKNFKLDENQRILLAHVEPWWDKELIKLIKKQRKRLTRFGQQADSFFPQTEFDYDQYGLLIKGANNFFSFYDSKIKEILKLPRAVAKFRRWYIQVENLRALLMGIICITQFYETLERTAIPNKRQFLINESYQVVQKIYQNYWEEINQLAPEETHDTLAQIFKNTPQVTENELFNPVLVFNLTHKYLIRLSKTKKINENLFVNLIFKTVSTAVFFQAYLKFQKHFLANVV